MVVVDMDGTLLNDKLKISERNLYAINRLIKNNMKVIFATGRVFKSAQYYAKLMNLDLPIITYNGALIRKVLSDDIMFSSKIDIKTAKNLLSFAEENDIYVKVYIDDILYVASESEETKKFSKDYRLPYKIIGKLSQNISSAPYMIVLKDNAEKIRKIRKKFSQFNNKDIAYTSSTPYCVEIMAAKVSKKLALQQLSKTLNIAREEIITIGNSLNDLEMLQWAGTGVAMKNSDEDLLKIYTTNISSHTNDEDGVYHILNELEVC